MFQFLDILGNGLYKISLVRYCNLFSQGRGVKVSLRQLENFRYIPHHQRHYIFHQSKIWVLKQGLDVQYILIHTRELQVLDHPGIKYLEHDVSMLLIKIELDRGSPLSY